MHAHLVWKGKVVTVFVPHGPDGQHRKLHQVPVTHSQEGKDTVGAPPWQET